MSATDKYTGSVLAIGLGYYGGSLRAPGERFHYDGVLGDWMLTPEQESERNAAETAAQTARDAAARDAATKEAALADRAKALEDREKALAEREAALRKK
jgi:hypothetical protein